MIWLGVSFMIESTLIEMKGGTAPPQPPKHAFIPESSQGPSFRYECEMGGPAALAFGEMLKTAIEAAGLSVREWAETRAATTNGQVFNIIAGRRTPPIDQVQKWGDLLGFTGERADRFYELACIAHLPDQVQAFFVKNMERRYELEGDYLRLLSDYRRVAESQPKYRGK